MDKQSGKVLILLKYLVALVLVTGISTTSVATVIYNVDRAVDQGRITGTIETNGAIGLLGSADIIDWNLTIDADGDPTTSGQLLGPISGNNSSIIFLDGSPLTATPTEMLFDFSLADAIFQIATPGADVVWQLQAGVFSDEMIQEAFLPGFGPIQAFAMHAPIRQQVATTGAPHVPVTYNFTTDGASFTMGCPACLFEGQPVSGSFVYDSDADLLQIDPPGFAIYLGGISDWFGSVGGNPFMDELGLAIVGDNIIGGTRDLLLLRPGFNLVGFDIGGFVLVDVRMRWLEGVPGDPLGTPPFLMDQNLPAVLPAFPGTLEMDFVNPMFPGPTFTVMFENLMVTQAPMPVIPMSVTMDIKPGSTPNSINPFSKGKIPVAILTAEAFDATQVDVSTIAFGPDGAPEAHGRSHVNDIDGDGDMDLVLHFKTQDTGIQCGDIEATLTGETHGGEPITGTDSINPVPCR